MNKTLFQRIFQADLTSSLHVMDFVDIASFILVCLGIAGAFAAIIGAFIVANAHIKNQKDVQEIIKKYDVVRSQVDALIAQNEIQGKRLRIGMEVANLRFEEEHNLTPLVKHYARIKADQNVAKRYSEAQIDKLKQKIAKYQNSLAARSRETQILLNRPGASQQQFEELQATYGDYDTLRFLKKLESVSLTPEEIHSAISTHAILAHRLINNVSIEIPDV